MLHMDNLSFNISHSILQNGRIFWDQIWEYERWRGWQIYLGENNEREKRSFPRGTIGKEPTCQRRRLRDEGLVSGLGRSPGEGMVTHSSILS